MTYTLPGNNFNQRGTVHRPDEVCRTIIGGGGKGGYHAGNEPKILVKEKRNVHQTSDQERLDLDGVGGVCDLSYPDSKTRRGRVTAAGQICPTLTAQNNEVYQIMENKYTYRIRKLTPLECWRLMGWDDESFHKAEAVNSNTQLYKQAGNGIVVPVLEAIFRQMLED